MVEQLKILMEKAIESIRAMSSRYCLANSYDYDIYRQVEVIRKMKREKLTSFYPAKQKFVTDLLSKDTKKNQLPAIKVVKNKQTGVVPLRVRGKSEYGLTTKDLLLKPQQLRDLILVNSNRPKLYHDFTWYWILLGLASATLVGILSVHSLLLLIAVAFCFNTWADDGFKVAVHHHDKKMVKEIGLKRTVKALKLSDLDPMADLSRYDRTKLINHSGSNGSYIQNGWSRFLMSVVTDGEVTIDSASRIHYLKKKFKKHDK